MGNFTKLLVTAYLVASGCLISSCNKETAVPDENPYVSVMNASPTVATGPLDLALADNAILIGDHAYKAASGFIQVDPGTYSFAINDSESGALKYQLAGQTLAAGKVYSIVALGMNNPADTDRAFTAELITNY